MTGPTVTDEETLGVEPRVVTVTPVEGPGGALLDTCGGEDGELATITGWTGIEEDISKLSSAGLITSGATLPEPGVEDDIS